MPYADPSVRKAYARAYYRAYNYKPAYKAWRKKYNKTLKRREAKKNENKRNRTKYPGKDRARAILTLAVRHGRLEKKPCEVCGGSAEAHHSDYRKPLVVHWFCIKHHRKLHRKKDKIEQIIKERRFDARTFVETAS